MTRKRRALIVQIPAHVVGSLALLAAMLPLVWMVSTSLKPTTEIFSGALNVIPQTFTLDNYTLALTQIPLMRYALNSVIMSTAITAGQLVTGILAAFAFARYTFRGQEFLFILFLGVMAIPIQVIMIPNYLLVAQLGWLNTWQGLIVPAIPTYLAVFLLRQHFRSFPVQLIEAAIVDGANSWQVLWRVVVPSSRSVLVAVAVILFLTSWNAYIWPLLVTSDADMRVIQLGVQQFAAQETGLAWGPLTAAASIATLPPLIFYLFMQRQIMQSFTNVGIR